MDNKSIAKVANNILEYLYDSFNGYKECAQTVADQRLKELFNSLANLRQSMINELQTEIKNLGEQPVSSGSVLAAAHRTWIDLKSLITGGNEKAIVEEVKRGETTTIDKYKEALNQELPANLKSILNKQVTSIENNLRTVETFASVEA